MNVNMSVLEVVGFFSLAIVTLIIIGNLAYKLSRILFATRVIDELYDEYKKSNNGLHMYGFEDDFFIAMLKRKLFKKKK